MTLVALKLGNMARHNGPVFHLVREGAKDGRDLCCGRVTSRYSYLAFFPDLPQGGRMCKTCASRRRTAA